MKKQPTITTQPQPMSANPASDNSAPGYSAIRGQPYTVQQAQPMEVIEMMKVFGDSGTKRFSGYYFEEYEQEWEHRERADLVEKMRRGDGYVQAALRALKSPLLATKWMVQTDVDKEDEKGEEIRAFVESQLFGMRRTWKEFLREALCYLDFGHYVFEMIWEMRDGKVCLVDLEPRIPASILYWRTKDGAFGITQILQTDEKTNPLPECPSSKLLILTNAKEGDDVTGQSVLRPAWKHWYYKDTLYKIQTIGAERFGAGIPVVEPVMNGDADKAAATSMAANMRTNETAFLYRPPGWKVEILVPQGHAHGAEIQAMIEHHGKLILMSVLANFLALGDNGAGSLALVRDKSAFFINALEDFASYLCEQVTNQVIRKIVINQFGEQDIYPHLAHAPIGDLDYQELSFSLATLANAGLIQSDDPKVSEYIHRAFKIPEISDDQMEMLGEQKIEADISKLEYQSRKEGTDQTLPSEGQMPPIAPGKP